MMTNIKHNTVVKIANEIAELVEKKNKDYKNSFDDTIDKYGEIAYIVRLNDKVSRIENLLLNPEGIEVKSEKVEDTIKDIIGYSLLMLRRIENEYRDFSTEVNEDF